MNLETLIQRYLEGRMVPEEMRELNTRLRTDLAARTRFKEMLNLDSALAEAASDSERKTAPLSSPIPFPGPRRKILRFAAATLAACLCLFAALYLNTPCATVLAVAGAQTVSDQSAWKSGKPIRTGEHQLTSGTVELLTRKGAHVVIEAPARFRFVSRQRLALSQGRIAAEVPPSAKGFTIVTPTGEAVDLGTRFGVDVQNNGHSEIHVFQGEVIAKNSSGQPQKNLRTGDALTLSTNQTNAQNLRASAFIQPGEVSSLSAGLAAGQQQRADGLQARLLQDPALITLIDFEKPLPNEGRYRITQGRWPGSKAAEFTELGDHMKVHFGGEQDWPELTLAAWVRIDQLGAPYQSLLHTDGWDNNQPGQVHWMVTQQMTMRLALRSTTLAPNAREKHSFPDSLTSILPERGRWVHLATVYDSKNHTTRFYLNGKADGVTSLDVVYPARLGPAQIGNWNQVDRKLSGRIDELVVLGRVLSDTEILALFESGTPYR